MPFGLERTLSHKHTPFAVVSSTSRTTLHISPPVGIFTRTDIHCHTFLSVSQRPRDSEKFIAGLPVANPRKRPGCCSQRYSSDRAKPRTGLQKKLADIVRDQRQQRKIQKQSAERELYVRQLLGRGQRQPRNIEKQSAKRELYLRQCLEMSDQPDTVVGSGEAVNASPAPATAPAPRSWANIAGGGSGGVKTMGRSQQHQQQQQQQNPSSQSQQPHQQQHIGYRAQQAHPPRERRPEQTPSTQGPPSPSSTRRQQPEKPETYHVLTLLTSPDLHKSLTILRNRHFPRHLNHLAAHITFFHALPGRSLEQFDSDISDVAGRTDAFRITCDAVGGIMSMKSGVGVRVAGGDEGYRGKEKCRGVREALRKHWADSELLSDQDLSGAGRTGRGEGWMPHWTVQNKENDGKRVKSAEEDVKRFLDGGEEGEGIVTQGWALGLGLWRYEEGGAWVWEKGFGFKEAEKHGFENKGELWARPAAQ